MQQKLQMKDKQKKNAVVKSAINEWFHADNDTFKNGKKRTENNTPKFYFRPKTILAWYLHSTRKHTSLNRAVAAFKFNGYEQR